MSDEVQPAQLSWDQHQPYSAQWQDIYFSRDNGLAESRFVFLQHNHLPARWQQGSDFTLIETGFGTGLNFLATAQAWLASTSPRQRLHYVALEQFPIASEQLPHSWQPWPELHSLGAELLRQYPPCIAGRHRLFLADSRIILTLIWGSVQTQLPRLQLQADAWYLDGFDPAKNPEMWSLEVFQAMTRLLKPQASFATFSAAGQVRRNLQAAGFVCEKVTGYGKKRESLRGFLPAVSSHRAAPATAIDSILIVGAGIAGAACADSLAQRGWRVTVLEQAAVAASGASGNPAGVVMPVLTTDQGSYGQFYLASYLYALQRLNRLKLQGLDWHPVGVLQRAADPRQAQRQAILAQRHHASGLVQAWDAAQVSSHCGEPQTSGGLFYPTAGWVRPPELCRQLLAAHPNIECHYGHCVRQLIPVADGWQVVTQDGVIFTAAQVILATAQHSLAFSQAQSLPLIPARGQISEFVAPDPNPLPGVVCERNYIIPLPNQTYCVGATYQRDDLFAECRAADHQHNHQQLRAYLPQLAAQLAPPRAGRVSFRAATPDRLPLIGAVPHLTETHAEPWPGLWLSAGHGARGLISGLLAAELLASQITGELALVESEVLAAIDPARFWHRAQRRKVGPKSY